MGNDRTREYEQAIKVSTDSIVRLRKVDVFRVLDWNENLLPGLAIWIKDQRPDLDDEVSAVLEELQSDLKLL